VFSHIREEYHTSKRNIMHKRRNSSHREKNSAATDKENYLLQKIIPLSLHPLQQRIRFLGVCMFQEHGWNFLPETCKCWN
jgi:hypothetical protein